MAATDAYPLVPTQEGTAVNAAPANENIVRMMALMAPALGFASAAPGTPAEGDQYVIGTTWGGFSEGNIVRYTAGKWREFSVFGGLDKVIGGTRYVFFASAWHQVADFVDIPATATSAGKRGNVAYDPSTLYFYVCVDTNTWCRTLMTSAAPPAPAPTPVDPATLLLHFDAAPIADDSGNGFTVITAGTAARQTTTFKFGSGAVDFNAGYLRVDDAGVAPGGSPFTFDAWVYFDDLSGQQFIFDERSPGGCALYQTDGVLNFYDGNRAVGVAFTGSSLTTSTWHHVQVSVDIDTGTGVGTAYLFQDGVLGGTLTPTTAYTNTLWIIGAAQYTPIGVNVVKGKMDEARIVIGQAMNVASFTPRTTPYSTH